ncbi:PQQ-binding-like beta-propeller repeat protein [Streptomyces sp. NPDC051907]|uniref:outer membrane protein assembly factor BamB family protein n=1 Tax=Streptomyces sp. NPDC051907 TaxID=3155284 RepID=UPI00343E00A1
MTQPPPPPNQPPGPPPGGFGAPQDPPPGGFGSPTPPPQPAQNPSYGYPQQPGAQPQPGYGYPQTPPPAEPGYGYPQTPPPGAAPQGPPPGQPGYGYPTQPAQPQYMPPPQPDGGSSGGRKKISTQMQIIIAAAVAVVLIVGAGVFYASTKDDGGGKSESENSANGGSKGTGGGDGDSGKAAADGPGKEKAGANTGAKVGFQLPPPPKRTGLTAVPGSWVTDKAYVKPGVDSVVAYDVAKGTPLWTTPLPGQVCAASRHVSKDNKTAIAFEAAKRKDAKAYEKCTEVGVIDLNTGKLLWSKSITSENSGDEKADYTEITLSGNTVAAADGDGGAAFDLNTGAVRWKPTIDGNQCRDIGYGGGAALVAVRRCGPFSDSSVVVQTLNPDNGTPLASFNMPTPLEDARVVSSQPLVVAADIGDTGTFGISDFFSIDGKTGKLRAKISAPADKYEARCPASDGVEGCQFVVVGNDRLYLPTAEHQGPGDDGFNRVNEIISFDLATGKGTSDRADSGNKFKLLPLRMDGGNIITLKKQTYSEPTQVVSINGADFKQTVLLETPGDKSVKNAENSFTVEGSEWDYASGRLFVSDDLLSDPKDELEPAFGVRLLALSFTTAD